MGKSTLKTLFGAPATNDRCANDQGKDVEGGIVLTACEEEEDNWWRNKGWGYHYNYCEDWDYLGWSDDESVFSDRNDTPLVINKSLQPLAAGHNNKKPTTITQLMAAGFDKPGARQRRHHRDIVHDFVRRLMRSGTFGWPPLVRKPLPNRSTSLAKDEGKVDCRAADSHELRGNKPLSCKKLSVDNSGGSKLQRRSLDAVRRILSNTAKESGVNTLVWQKWKHKRSKPSLAAKRGVSSKTSDHTQDTDTTKTAKDREIEENSLPERSVTNARQRNVGCPPDNADSITTLLVPMEAPGMATGCRTHELTPVTHSQQQKQTGKNLHNTHMQGVTKGPMLGSAELASSESELIVAGLDQWQFPSIEHGCIVKKQVVTAQRPFTPLWKPKEGKLLRRNTLKATSIPPTREVSASKQKDPDGSPTNGQLRRGKKLHGAAGLPLKAWLGTPELSTSVPDPIKSRLIVGMTSVRKGPMNKMRKSSRTKQWRRCSCGRLYRIRTGSCACKDATAGPAESQIPAPTVSTTTSLTTPVKASVFNKEKQMIRSGQSEQKTRECNGSMRLSTRGLTEVSTATATTGKLPIKRKMTSNGNTHVSVLPAPNLASPLGCNNEDLLMPVRQEVINHVTHKKAPLLHQRKRLSKTILQGISGNKKRKSKEYHKTNKRKMRTETSCQATQMTFTYLRTYLQRFGRSVALHKWEKWVGGSGE